MRVDVSFKHLEKSPLLNNVVDKNLKKIERRVSMFKDDDVVHLSLHLEKNPHRDEYLCWTNIYLPSKVIKGQSKSATAQHAMNDCFAALTKQLDKFKHRLESGLRKKIKPKEFEIDE